MSRSAEYTPAADPFADLVEECLDEAVFLWRRWEDDLLSRTRNLDEVWSWTEDRLHGALDGVRAGGAGSDLIVNGLLSADPDRIAVCAAVLASSEDRAATDTLATALAAADGDRLKAIMRALEVAGSDDALRTAARILAQGPPPFAAALCRLKVFRRSTPGAEVQAALRSGDTAAQAEAVRAAAWLPDDVAARIITAGQQSADAGVRLAAVETGLSRGMPRSWAAAKEAAAQQNAAAAPYLRHMAMLGGDAEHEIVYAALRLPSLQVDAVRALGHIGTVRAVEACLAGMQYEKVARLCGEAYCWITGADLERDHLAVPPEPPPEPPPFEEDDLDADLVPPPEASWPLPDPDKVARDWRERAPQFAAGTRYAQGRRVTRSVLLDLVERGPMLRRADLVFELRARSHGAYDVETRAFIARQHQMMARGRAALASRDGH